MGFFSFARLGVALLTLLAARRVYWELTVGSQRRAFSTQHGCVPAHKKKTRLPFGLDMLLKDQKKFREYRVLEYIIEFFRDENAHTIDLRYVGQHIFVTDDPENIKTVLATDFGRWSIGVARIKWMGSFLGTGIFTSEGPVWKHSRETLRPCFERSQVSDISLLDKHTTRLIDSLSKDGSTVDLQPLIQDLTMDITSDFLFGISTDSLDKSKDDKHTKEFIKAFEYIMVPFDVENLGLWTVVEQLLPNRKLKKCTKILQDFADRIIDEEIAARKSSPSKPSRYVFLHELLDTVPDRIRIRSELLNIFLAGRDTTSALLSNVLWTLSRSPTIQSRLRREITSHIGDAVLPTFTQLKDMRYLKAIMNESQRLYPVVPSNTREALVDTTLPRGGGPDEQSPVFVPKGASITYHIVAMHRRVDVYGEDADVFEPARWMDGEHGSSPLRPGWGYLPFSGGPRVCIGQQFALTEAMFVVVRMLQTFPVLESRDSEPWTEKINITASNRNGCKVSLRMAE
ncbi:cytochrome P450 [Polyplosphaeria fusca]|uniref:Cytochrome P450 n=1 Tax=Polyplosphaeria fusca TaxID=682080 RepID=A0A9P4UXM5_9PLEO|nr:cytochrome P450 [Polyplosphaeria fusca]